MSKYLYYKSANGEVYSYSDDQVKEGWVKEGLVQMTEEEINDHLDPVPTVEQLASTARYERDKALKALDEVVSNPLRFSGLLEEQQLEAVTYRRLLLDVPQQESFPVSYTLPKTPEWLN